MADLLPVALRAAGSYTTDSSVVPAIRGRDVQVTFPGLTDAELSNPAFAITTIVQATDASGANPPDVEWYELQRSNWNGGHTSKPGGWTTPAFSFRVDEGAASRRMRGQVVSSLSATWGVTAVVV